MSSLVRALTVQRLLREDSTLRMLRMDTLPVLSGILDEHLGAPNARIPTQDLHEAVDAELDSLRTHLDLSDRTAKAYCDDWRQAGLLLRRPASDARAETYELTPEARHGLRIIGELIAPRASATESRLVSLTGALHQLAIATDPDVGSRLEALQAERDALDERIRRVRSGETDVLDSRRALERVGDILAQAEDLPTDFARVRARFEELNHELRVNILTGDDLPGGVLDEVFRGVDLIESSDVGQTFAAFSRLVRDPEISESFEADLRAILDRDFARSLSPSSRTALRGLVRTLKDGSRTVQDSLAEFARGLRRYVLSLEYQRDRQLRLTLQDALAAAVPALASTRPYHPSGLALEMTGMQLASVGEVTLHDPSEYDAGPVLDDAPVAVVDVETLRAIARQTEIDFAELEDHIHAVLTGVTAERLSAGVSVAEVLEAFPASQGVASVVGLLSLAARHGTVDAGHTDLVSWDGEDGRPRHARVVRHAFTGRIRS
jgi:hypothetical protein